MKTNFGPEETEKKRRIMYCPVCETEMINLFELVEHVHTSGCDMTIERLVAVGVLDPGEVTLNN